MKFNAYISGFVLVKEEETQTTQLHAVIMNIADVFCFLCVFSQVCCRSVQLKLKVGQDTEVMLQNDQQDVIKWTLESLVICYRDD